MLVLKDSHPDILAASNVEPKGRTYDKDCGQEAGGIQIKDVVLGMKLASLAITDDNPDTLRNVGKMNPWHIEALKMITGSEEQAHLPLSTLLYDYFNLKMDYFIDVSGFIKGRPVDTQGYIAHNDEIIVLSYRCTTSVLDWLTNFSTSSSEWEPDVDVELGHAGHCSCLMGRFCWKSDKPRVHTGFYNNFLSTVMAINKYITPLLQPDQPPRKLFVVGHSLGAGIATLASCYFLLNFDWENLPQTFMSVTAGSPRSVQPSMRELIDERMKVLRPLDKAVVCRIVLNKDVVTNVPPTFFGYTHIDKLVYITEDGEVIINPNLDSKNNVDKKKLKKIFKKEKKSKKKIQEDTGTEKSEYEKKLALVPGLLKDHMPDFYLKPLIRVFERELVVQEALSCSVYGVDTGL